MSSLVSVRSLGRLGHHITVAAADPQAIAGVSRYAGDCLTVPVAADEAEAYVRWIAEVCAERGIEHIYWATTASALALDRFRDLLDRVAGSLRQYPNSLIDVYGHTDTTGSATTNQRLSEQRAQAVANYLISQGVSSSRVRWMGFGETRLKVSTGDNVNEPLNRRVEIKIVPFDQRDIEAAQSQGM